MDDKNLTQRHNSRVYDNFLMHWKYKYKKKVNGKWRYFYDVGPAGFDVGGNGPGRDGEIDSNIQSYTKFQDIIGKDEKDAYIRSLQKALREVDYQNANPDRTARERKVDEKNMKRVDRAVSEDMERFYKTPLGKIESTKHSIESGRKFVSDLLAKASEKVKPNDNLLSSIEKRYGNRGKK